MTRTVFNDFTDSPPKIGVLLARRGEVVARLPDVGSGDVCVVGSKLDDQELYVEVPANLICEVRVGPRIARNRAASYGQPMGKDRAVTVRNDYAESIRVVVFIVEGSTWDAANGGFVGGGRRNLADVGPGEFFDVPDELGWPPVFVEVHSQLISVVRVGPKPGHGKKA